MVFVDLHGLSQRKLLLRHNSSVRHSSGTYFYLDSILPVHFIKVVLLLQIFLLTDVLFAQAKYDYHLEHGTDLKINGKEGMLVLE